MLTLAETELHLPEGILLNQSFGSIFHGALISELDREWAAKMHEQRVRPYSQYLLVKEGKPYWRLAVLTEEAFEHILRPIMRKDSLCLEQKGYEVGLDDFHMVKQDSFQGLEERFWTGTDKVHHIDLEFLTSASFKKNGEYMIFPELPLVLNSLIRKWNAYSDSMVLGEERLGDKLAESMCITDYRLHTHPFSVEGRRIRAFRGNIRLGLFKDDITRRMASMLAAFADYAGIGIKTAMGMGAVESDISYYQKKERL